MPRFQGLRDELQEIEANRLPEPNLSPFEEDAEHCKRRADLANARKGFFVILVTFALTYSVLAWIFS